MCTQHIIYTSPVVYFFSELAQEMEQPEGEGEEEGSSNDEENYKPLVQASVDGVTPSKSSVIGEGVCVCVSMLTHYMYLMLSERQTL